MRFEIKILFLCLSLIFSDARAVSAQSLRDAVTYAIDNHPAIEGAKAAQEAAQYGRRAERSHYYPELSVGLSAGRVYQDNSTSRGLTVSRGAAYSGYGEGNLAVRQMLFDGLKTKSRVDAAQARVQSQHYSMLDTQGEVAARVVRSYIDVISLRRALFLLSEQSEALVDYQDRINSMVERGVADDAELQQARDVSMVVDSVKTEYEGRLLSAEAVYYEAVGKAPPVDMVLPSSVSELVEQDLDEIVALAKAKHPVIKAAKMRSEAAGLDKDAELGKLYPDLAGELSYNKVDKMDVIGGESEDARAILKMNWNFSTGGREMAAVSQKKSEYQEAMYKAQEMERQIERDIKEAYARYLTFWRKAELSMGRVELNEKLFDTYKSQFEASRISLLSLMQAQSQLFRAKLEHSDNSFNLLAAQYSALAARGDLVDVVTSFSPTQSQ